MLRWRLGAAWGSRLAYALILPASEPSRVGLKVELRQGSGGYGGLREELCQGLGRAVPRCGKDFATAWAGLSAHRLLSHLPPIGGAAAPPAAPSCSPPPLLLGLGTASRPSWRSARTPVSVLSLAAPLLGTHRGSRARGA